MSALVSSAVRSVAGKITRSGLVTRTSRSPACTMSGSVFGIVTARYRRGGWALVVGSLIAPSRFSADIEERFMLRSGSGSVMRGMPTTTPSLHPGTTERIDALPTLDHRARSSTVTAAEAPPGRYLVVAEG